MITDSEISDTLVLLKDHYDAEFGVKKMPELYSKIALLELCGWIEDSMDEIVDNFTGWRILIQFQEIPINLLPPYVSVI